MIYSEYKDLSTRINPVAILVNMFRDLHDTAPDSDYKTAGGRMAGIWKLCNPDLELAMRVIWATACLDIQGSHLDYITKAVSERVKKKPRKLAGSAGVEIV